MNLGHELFDLLFPHFEENIKFKKCCQSPVAQIQVNVQYDDFSKDFCKLQNDR